jgi:hypoxanthine phosphoribosyltransferase
MSGTGESTPSGGLYQELLFTEAEVEARIVEMAAEITKRFDPDTTLFVSLLNGAQPFASKLMFAIQACHPNYHPNVQSIIVSRYGINREPGQLRLVTDLPPEYRDLTGYWVVVLDDLVDGGETLAFAREHLLGYGAKGVEYVVLVRKQKGQPAPPALALFGFETPDRWLTGMGMDDNRLGREANRWAGWIAIAND